MMKVSLDIQPDEQPEKNELNLNAKKIIELYKSITPPS